MIEIHLNLTSSAFKALKRSSKNKYLVIQKADQAKTAGMLDKQYLISPIEEILNDKSKFLKLGILAGREINHIVNNKKRITSELELSKYKEISDKSSYKSMKPIGPRPGILHGLSKIHSENRNGIPRFLPILSGIDITTYKLATFLL